MDDNPQNSTEVKTDMPKRKAGKAGIYAKGAKVFRKKAKGTVTLTKAVKNAITKVGEKKFVDTSISFVVPSAYSGNNGAVVLNLIQEGSSSFERTGRTVKLEAVRIRGYIRTLQRQEPTVGNMYANLVRIVVVWDREPTGTIPDWNAIFLNVDQTGGTANLLFSSVKPEEIPRFSVLRDVTTQIIPQVFPTGGSENFCESKHHIDEYIKLNMRETHYTSANSDPCTIANIKTGALYLYARASEQNTDDESSLTGMFGRLAYYE